MPPEYCLAEQFPPAELASESLADSRLARLLAPEELSLIKRLAGWPRHYPWIEPEGLQYFRSRVTQARRDVAHGLSLTLDDFRSREQQERALDILQFKLDVLWSMNDAMAQHYGVST